MVIAAYRVAVGCRYDRCGELAVSSSITLPQRDPRATLFRSWRGRVRAGLWQLAMPFLHNGEDLAPALYPLYAT
jgi:hypothetical protein